MHLLFLAALAADLDGDGVDDADDNCGALANADQADGDGDGFGDACDPCATADGFLIRAFPVLGSVYRGHPADLDGDGDLDVVATYGAPDRLGWIEHTSAAAGYPVEIGAGEAVLDVVASDVDGDGDLDLLVADVEPSGVRWHEHTGGGFGAVHPLFDEDGASMLHLADLDGDGVEDLVVGSEERFGGAGRLAWARGTAPGFGALQGIDDGDITDLDSADLDGDGDLDLVVASTGRLRRYENLGGGAWASAPDLDVLPGKARYGTGEVSERVDFAAVVAGDLDGDGDLDVVGAKPYAGGSLVWYANELGGFGPPQPLANGAHYPKDLELADVDGDGDLDLVSAAEGRLPLAWHENLGGRFGKARPLEGVDARAAYSVALGDVDGNGSPDVLAVHDQGRALSWFVNDLCGQPDPVGDTGTPGPSGDTGGPGSTGGTGDTGRAGTMDTGVEASGPVCGCRAGVPRSPWGWLERRR